MKTPRGLADRRRPPLPRRRFLATSAVLPLSAAAAQEPPAPTAEAARNHAVLGYPARLSVAPGETLPIHVSTTAATFDVTVERVGPRREVVWRRAGIPGREHAVPAAASADGCGWPAAFEVPIGRDWRSGYYEVVTSPASFVADATGGRQPLHIFFVVRSAVAGPRAPILLQLSTNTDAAYNNFGGFSLYAFNGRDGVQGSRVSFLRPMPAASIRAWEVPFIRWAEANGYRLDYAVNGDLERHPGLLDGRRLVLSVGHDEYWSAPMRDAVESFVARGGNAAFFSGNACCWQVRHERDGLVCHKQHFAADPLYKPAGPNPTLTTLWSHPLVGRPENTLTNVGVLHGGFHRSHGQLTDGSGAFTVERPDHWVFAGTGLDRGSEFGGGHTVVGYECDGCEFTREDGLPVPTGADGTPREFEILATAPATWGSEETFTWFDRFPQKQPGHACLGIARRAGGGLVFTAATTDWAHGLAASWEAPAGSPAARGPDPVIERITRNVLDRLS
ncbi:MAG: N,N-dimethylformamidase beta subunit family domain-containing protein [Planctomycetia bacterium]